MRKIKAIGNISEIDFAKKKNHFKKLRDCKEQEFRSGIGFILSRAKTLAGFKDPIDDASKQDIKEMIMMKWLNLSLEEIDFAFKLDRYSEKPVAHYQLFNASYVYKILHNYFQWLTRMNWKISLSPKKQLPPNPEKEKQAKIDMARDVFNELQKNEFYIGAWHLYDKMDIPEEYKTKEFKWKNYKKQQRIARTESSGNKALDPYKSITEGYVIMRCKAYDVCQILKGIDNFEEFLSYTNISK